MEAKMEKIENNVVKLEVRVEAEKFNEALKKAYNKNKMHFNVQGFRKGKVPMAMVKKYYGIEVLFDDAINFVIDETYPKTIEENNLRPVDYPQINVLGEYKGLEVAKNSYEVKEEEVEAQLKSMQEKNARVEVKAEGTVENGDIAVIDFKGFIDGVAFEGGEGKDYPLEIGSGSFIDNFEEQLVGAAVGETREVKVKFPEAYGNEELNDKDATFEVTVKEIKAKELPTLDDEFAKDVSEFDTIAELKEDVAKKIQENNDNRAEREYEDAVINAAIETATIDLPEVMVEKEIDHMIKDLESRLQYQGLTLDQYMEFTGNTVEKMRDYMRANAERKVKADLVLEAIAKAENIVATEEELKEKATEVAKMYSAGETEKMVELLMNSQKAMLENDIVMGKTIQLLKDNCKTA